MIKLNDLYINSIPTELYNNKDFSLKIAKTINEKPNIKKELPNFVQLFFSKINSNYYDYLNSHILYHNLQNKVEKTTTKAPIKKI